MRPVGPNDRTVVPGAEAPQIGGYTVMRLIGHGGAGRVFAARDEQLGRTVAIKVQHPQVASDPTNAERFLREARAMATISSPHVASIFQVGQHKGVPFIVMEYLEGQNLEQRLHKERRIPVEEALVYVRDCALALKAADTAGLVHRDVKPANILVIDGRAKLTDFGTARPMDGSANMTVEGEIAGTAMFLAPERVTGQGDDRRADIYSLGATLYCLINGEPPFVRENSIDVIAAHLKEEPVALDEKVPGVSPLVANLVKRMMAKEPTKRFQTYDELGAAIDMLLRGGAPSANESGAFDEATEVMSVDAASLPAPPPLKPRPPPAAPPPPPVLMDEVDANDPFATPPPSFGGTPQTNSMVGEPTGVMGTLKQMSIVDICHMLEMGKKDAEIELTALEGINGTLSFLGGQVVYCVWGNDVAEEAFYTIARRTEGFFRIHYGRRTAVQNIQVPTAFLVLEAMRRLDELERGGPDPEADIEGFFDNAAEPSQPSGYPETTLPNEAPIPVHSGEFAMLPENSGELGPFPGDEGEVPAVVGLPLPPEVPSQRPPERAPTRPPAPAVPRTPHTPAPIDGIAPPAVRGAMQVRPGATRSSPTIRTTRSSPNLPAAPSSSPDLAAATRNDTMLLTPEDEAALRAADGKAVPLAQRLEPALEQAKALYGKTLGLANAQLAAATAKALEQTPLKSAAPTVRAHPWLPLVALCTLFFLLAFVLVAILSSAPTAELSLERIDGGEAAAVLEEIEAISLEERTAQHELFRGHALAQLGRPPEALAAYRSAAKLGVVEERGLALALEHLGDEKAAPAMDLLVAYPGDAAVTALLTRVKDGSWAVRHNALRALEERGAKDRADLEALAIQDLLTGPSCKQRRLGLLDLKRHGRSDAARGAFKKALELKEGENACMRAELEEMAPK